MTHQYVPSGSVASLLPALAILCGATALQADVDVAPVVGMSVSGGSGWSYWLDSDVDGATGFDAETNHHLYEGGALWAECDVWWDHWVEVDPGLGFGFTVTNNLDVVEEFTLVALVEVPGWSRGTLINASLGGSVTDSNFDGFAELAGSSDGLLTTFLDGTKQLDVGPGITATVRNYGGTSGIGIYNTPVVAGPGSTDGLLEVELSFTLTPGDTAALSGAFVVNYVPAPGALLAFAGFGVARRRRR